MGPSDRVVRSEKPYWLFFSGLVGEVVLDDPDVPPAAPLVPLAAPEVEPSLPAASLAPLDELELGALGEDELPDAELELGLDGVAPEDEDELGELGVVALPVADPEAAPGRLLMSLELEPEEDEEPGVAELPLLASPGRSQP